MCLKNHIKENAKPLESGFGVVPCGVGILRYTEDAKGNVWYALQDIYDALRVTKQAISFKFFEDSELTAFHFIRGSHKHLVTIPCISQSGLFRVILRSDLEVFRPFKLWLAEGMLEKAFGSKYLSVLLPYVTGHEPLTALEVPVLKNETK